MNDPTPHPESAEPRYALDSLATLAEVPTRTVRFYIQNGLVDRPEGSGKGAWYTPRHLEQLLQVRKWQLAGLSLERIRELLHAPADPALLPPAPRRPGTVEVWSHLVVGDGIELVIEPGRARLSPEQVRALFADVRRAFERIRSQES